MRRSIVEEVSAEYYNDFSMTGYFAEALNATLEMYDSSDYKGKRTEFRIDRRLVKVRCVANRRR
jgi:hypothetical protein